MYEVIFDMPVSLSLFNLTYSNENTGKTDNNENISVIHEEHFGKKKIVQNNFSIGEGKILDSLF